MTTRFKILLALILLAFTFTSVMPALAQPDTADQQAAAYKIVKFKDPVKVNSNAQLKIKTTPGVKCNLAYTTPAGTRSVAKGLGAKVADKKGFCAWKWKIGSGTCPGTGTLFLTVDGATKRIPIRIK